MSLQECLLYILLFFPTSNKQKSTVDTSIEDRTISCNRSHCAGGVTLDEDRMSGEKSPLFYASVRAKINSGVSQLK